jgi:hypothetical protein
MMSESVSERFRLPEKLISVKQKVAEAITDEFFRDHSELAVRYGKGSPVLHRRCVFSFGVPRWSH